MSNKVPYISTYYIKPVLKVGEDNILNFYVTDAEDKAYLEENDDYRYKVIITRQNKEDIVLYNLKAGEHTVNLGSYDQEGEYEFSIIARDQYGRFSPELFNFIKVSNGRVNNTYHVTEQDLIDYGIKYNNDREIRLLLDCSDIFVDYTNSNERIAKMKERTAQTVADYDLPSGHYVVAIPDRDGDGVYQGKHKDCMNFQAVRYADGYDKEAVELECNETRLGIQKLLNDKRAEGYNHVIMYKAVYTINANFTGDDFNKDQGIRVPNGMDLDLNGSTIKLNPFVGHTNIMMYISDSEDTHLHNGIIEGDYFAHDYANSTKNSEWVCGVELGGKSKYCSIYDLEIRDITGYGLTNGFSRRGEYPYTEGGVKNCNQFTAGIDIDQTTGEEIENKYRSTCDYQNVINCKYMSCSRYLGYQGNSVGTWNMIMHFYDKDKKYLKSINAFKYRAVRIPDGAVFVRTTILYPVNCNHLSYQFFNVPTHCQFKNIKIDNARCVGCAPSQMKDILFENIKISNSGQCSANCALDAEDGWDGMQDVTFRNMIFHDNPLNNWLVCAGHNFIIEDSPNITAIHAYGRCRGLVIKNTTANSIYIENKGVMRTFIPRFYNVQSKSWNTPGILKDSKQTITGSILTPINNCELLITSSGNISGAKLLNSRVTLSNWSGYLSGVSYKNVDFYGANEGEIKFSMNYNGDNTSKIPAMYNCRFHHYTNFANHNGFCNGLFVNCEFNEGYTSGIKVMSQDELDKYNYVGHIYQNCKFDKVKQIAQISPFAYSSGHIEMLFQNCEFTFRDDAVQMFYAYSCASNGSTIKFKNCTFNNAENIILYNEYYTYDREGLDITIEFENCIGIPSNIVNPNKNNTKGQVKINIK